MPMTRRLFAILALLSGLAALHAPANASRLDQLSYDVQALADAVNAKGGAVCQCEHPPQEHKRVCQDPDVQAMRPRLLGILPPSLVLGADRALE
ncbi:MAG: hypothetical protein AAF559_12430 [Pseudomonadota bacterium]